MAGPDDPKPMTLRHGGQRIKHEAKKRAALPHGMPNARPRVAGTDDPE